MAYTVALSRGVPEKLFDANAAAAPVNSSDFALPPGKAPKYLSWTTFFASAPASCTIKLQVTNDIVNGPWSDLDSSTATAGETKNVGPIGAAFIRGVKSAQSGGGALTLTVTVGA